MKKIILAGIVAILAGMCQTARAEKLPEDCTFLMAGVCFDCNTPYILKMGNRDNCLKKCPKRMYNDSTQTCELPNPLASKVFDEFYDENTVDMKHCKEGGHFLNIDEDKCFPCDTKEMVWVKPNCIDDYECRQKCPNREIKYMYANLTQVDVASVLACPEERPLMDKNMMCWSCDEPTPIAVGIRKDSAENICGEARESVIVGKVNDVGFVEVVSYPCKMDNVGADGAAKCRRCNGKLMPDNPQCAEIAKQEAQNGGAVSESDSRVITVRSKL